MNDLIGAVGEVQMIIQIKRKETGKIETYELVGFVDEDQLKEIQNVSNTLNVSAEHGD